MYKRIEKYLYKYNLRFINIDLDYNQISHQVDKLNVSKLVNTKNKIMNKLISKKLILKELNSL